MAQIAGVKLIRNTSGKVTHVTLSLKHHGKLVEDLIDAAEMEKARRGDLIPWDEAKKQLNQTIKRRAK
ncbi:hypothetical protein BH10BAC3_BH10BAC3_28020 [soil metagenome]